MHDPQLWRKVQLPTVEVKATVCMYDINPIRYPISDVVVMWTCESCEPCDCASSPPPRICPLLSQSHLGVHKMMCQSPRGSYTATPNQAGAENSTDTREIINRYRKLGKSWSILRCAVAVAMLIMYASEHWPIRISSIGIELGHPSCGHLLPPPCARQCPVLPIADFGQPSCWLRYPSV